jgi:UDP-N-acetylmuramoylalanine--D-glutamate ligase
MGPNAAAAVAAAVACGLDGELVGRAAAGFTPLPHRMATVAVVRDVAFVDDSKATNLAALCAAVEMADRPVRLIAGGQLKETRLAAVKKLLAKKVRSTYLIGDAAERMGETWGDAVVCRPCKTLDCAVRAAWEEAEDGDMVLLSPGCASFDQFRNFEERGKQFAELVKSISGEA